MAIDPSTPDEHTTAESTHDAEESRAETTDALTEKVQHLKSIPATDDAAQITVKRAATDKPKPSDLP